MPLAMMERPRTGSAPLAGEPPAVRAEGLGKTFPRDGFAASLLERLRPSNWFGRGTGSAGGFKALDDVSFDIPVGDAVAILGGNGAGKSTLLKILARITPPTAGRVALRGRVACLLEVGTGFHRELTGRENIYLNGAVLGMSRAEVRGCFAEIVAFAGLEPFLDRPVKSYSSGMHARLAFSVAAHLRGDILLVDEVLAVGDHEFQQRCLGKMQELGRDGRTVVFVSHSVPAVRHLCRSALLLKAGRVACRGTVEECLAAYLPREPRREIQLNPDRPGTCLRRATVDPTDDGVRVELTVSEAEPGVRLRPSVILHDAHGRPLAGTQTFLLPKVASSEEAGSNRVCRCVCRLDLTAFRSGTYRLSVGLSSNRASQERHDQVLTFAWDNASLPPDLPPESLAGPCLIPQTWRIAAGPSAS